MVKMARLMQSLSRLPVDLVNSMYNHHINEMLAIIRKNTKLTKASYDQIYHSLEAYWSRYAVHVWGVDDVVGRSIELGYPMGEDAAIDILRDIEDHVDAELGITWMTLDCAISDWKLSQEEPVAL